MALLIGCLLVAKILHFFIPLVLSEYWPMCELICVKRNKTWGDRIPVKIEGFHPVYLVLAILKLFKAEASVLKPRPLPLT